MLFNKQCQTCETTQEPLMLDSRTEQIEKNLASQIPKWSSEMEHLEYFNCKPCWVRAVEQTEEIAYRDGNLKDIRELTSLVRYKYLKQGLGVVKERLKKR